MRNSSKVGLRAACGGAVITLLLLPIGAVGSAQEQDAGGRCAPLYRNAADRQANALLSAHIYSQENVGAVGISIFPGQDLPANLAHSVGMKLVTAFEQNGIQAACFVHTEIGSSGSGFNFKITGLAWSEDGPMSISEATNIETLRGVAAEARTARALLN